MGSGNTPHIVSDKVGDRMNTKLTDTQRDEVAELYAAGSPLKEIKLAYDLSPNSDSVIYRILREKGIAFRTSSNGRQLGRPAKVKFKPADPDMVERAFGKTIKIEEPLPIDEALPERNTQRKRFRLTLKVRLTFEADSMEGAIAKAKGYNGFQEVLSVTRVG